MSNIFNALSPNLSPIIGFWASFSIFNITKINKQDLIKPINKKIWYNHFIK